MMYQAAASDAGAPNRIALAPQRYQGYPYDDEGRDAGVTRA